MEKGRQAVVSLVGWSLMVAALGSGSVASSGEGEGLDLPQGFGDVLALAVAWDAPDEGTFTATPAPAVAHPNPSVAAAGLAARFGRSLDATDAAGLALLDAQPAPLRAALAEALGAFTGMDTAAVAAYGPLLRGDADAAARLEAGMPDVLRARAHFLDAVAHLHAAARLAPPLPTAVDLCPAVAFDLRGEDSTYAADCALILDLGGNDRYLNNAGGNNLRLPPVPLSHLVGRCLWVYLFDWQWPALGAFAPTPGAAAVVDLGGGDDIYGDPDRPRDCGVVGGGSGGVGIIVDQAGNDQYGGSGTGSAPSVGANGGGALGMGMIVDAAGDDRYHGGSWGTNGGAGGAAWVNRFLGVRVSLMASSGLLLDAAGNDLYLAGGEGTNGGSSTFGRGALLDLAGDDRYTAGSRGVNGGAFSIGASGSGLLVDLGGHDHYQGWRDGVNGGAHGPASGRLIDSTGDDRYDADIGGVNGGAAGPGEGSVGHGCLQDAAGLDHYGDREGGAGVDVTLVPKGTLGAQIDRSGPQPESPSGCEVPDFAVPAGT